MRSFLNTTLPGVAAMFSPILLKWLVSTCRGRPPLCSRSSTKCPAPAARLAPPVSIARLTAAGLVRKFVGASASSRKSAASPAFASAAASPAPAARTSAASWMPARYACRSAKNAGLSFHAWSGSPYPHRRERAALPATLASAPRPPARSGPCWPSTAAWQRQRRQDVPLRASARWPATRRSQPGPRGGELAGLLGASASAAASAASQAASCRVMLARISQRCPGRHRCTW